MVGNLRLEVLWTQSRAFRNSRKHFGADFFTVVKGEQEVGPAFPCKAPMRTNLPFDYPTDPK